LAIMGIRMRWTSTSGTDVVPWLRGGRLSGLV
jgi:hypothetical protein